MALTRNGSHQYIGLSRFFGAVGACGLRGQFDTPGMYRNFDSGEHAVSGVTNKASIPAGSRHPQAWKMGTKVGSIASANDVEIGFTVSPQQLIPALNAASTINDWSIVINQAALALVVGGVATINFDMDVDPLPNLSGSLSATANVPFDITVSSFLGAINGAGASIGMSLSITSTATAKGSISATITSEGEAVTPTSVAAAVWNALTVAYNTAGTMGAAMSASGTAGQILGTLLSNVNSHTDSAVAGIDTTSLKYAIESLRKDHQGFGTAYFWDPINGSDANDGLTPTTAKSSWTAVEALTQDGAGDTIYILPDPGSTQVTITDRISITKKSLSLRGPGRTIKFKPAGGTGDTITIGALNVAIQGIIIEGATGDTTGACVVINDKFARIENCWINRHGNGIKIRAGDYHRIQGNEIELHASDAILFEDAGFATPGSPREAVIIDNTIYFNSGNGIKLTATGANSTRLNILINNRIHHNTGYGVYIGADTERTMVLGTNYIKDNQTYPTGTEDPANEIYVDAAASDPMIDNMMDTLPASFGSYVLEGATTRDEVTRIMAAALAGTSNKAGSTITFKGIDGTTDRIVGSYDAENNRTGATLDGS
jgi:hypothetical protein